MTVEASGFKKLVRQAIEERVADQLSLDLALEVGAMQVLDRQPNLLALWEQQRSRVFTIGAV